MIAASIILEKLEKCSLLKLSRNLEECENHPEFAKWEENLTENFPAVINLLNDLNLKECNEPSSVLSSLLLLYLQLNSNGQWQTRICEEYAHKLNYQFKLLYDSALAVLLKSNKVYEPQEVFDITMKTLCLKLSSDDFKRYPALIEAYYYLIKELKDYKVVLQPATVFPISLILIEDYVTENRLKGLECCSFTLKCLTPDDFESGNYYEVVYRVLKKVIFERDMEVTKWVLICLLDLISIVPPETKVAMVDDILTDVLEQIYTESNLYRKKEFFVFVNKIIPGHGIHCVNQHLFLPVMIDNLDVCSNKAVGEILLADVVECFELWIQYCWCVWKSTPNQKLMSILLKMLFISKEKEIMFTKIQNIFIALCKLSSDEERKEISINIKKCMKQVRSMDEPFAKKLERIRSILC